MKVDQLILGAYQTNSYVVRAEAASTDCLVIDTGLDSGALVDFLAAEQLQPTALVLTHGHVDHIAGIGELREHFAHVEVYIHELDAEMLTDPATNLSALSGGMFEAGPADELVKGGDVIKAAGLVFTVLHTPGHTPGGISLYSAENAAVFVGDALFADSVGRTDFPGGSMAQLVTSIKTKLLSLPDETVVYPGHGPSTTIGRERSHNQYLL